MLSPLCGPPKLGVGTEVQYQPQEPSGSTNAREARDALVMTKSKHHQWADGQTNGRTHFLRCADVSKIKKIIALFAYKDPNRSQYEITLNMDGARQDPDTN